jgi:hypothetical protein
MKGVISMAKEVVYSAAELAALAILENASGPLSLSEINALADLEIKTGSMTSLKKKGRITSEVVETEVVRPVKTKYNVYSLVR